LDLNGPASAPRGKSSSPATAAPCSPSDSPPPSASPTSAIAAGGETRTPCSSAESPAGSRPSIFLAADSPARILAPPESAPASLKASAAGYGPNLPASFASFDRATSSWRTSQRCLPLSAEAASSSSPPPLAEFWETWPRSGMTRSGRAFELPTLAPRTDETECGSWPTPHGMGSDGHGNELSMLVQTVEGVTDLDRTRRKYPDFSPTPLPSDVDGGRTTKGKKRQHETGLRRAAMWPTPTATDGRRGADYNRANRRDGGGRDLVTDVGGQLNPTWFEWLMGYPLGWTALEPSEMPSSRRSRKSSAARSSSTQNDGCSSSPNPQK
jgi:hypothetical protein